MGGVLRKRTGERRQYRAGDAGGRARVKGASGMADEYVVIDRAARPFYVQRRNGGLRAVPLASPWDAPAGWTETVDLAAPDLAALKLLLYLAWSSPADGPKRAYVARKALAQWAALAGGRLPPGREFERRARLASIKSLHRRAGARVSGAQAFLSGLIFAAGARDGGGVRFTGAASVNAIARRLAVGAGKASADTVRARRWNDARPILHLADAAFQAGGIGAIEAGLAGDAELLQRLLEDAEARRCTLLPMVGIGLENTIKFWPLASSQTAC